MLYHSKHCQPWMTVRNYTTFFLYHQEDATSPFLYLWWGTDLPDRGGISYRDNYPILAKDPVTS